MVCRLTSMLEEVYRSYENENHTRTKQMYARDANDEKKCVHVTPMTEIQIIYFFCAM